MKHYVLLMLLTLSLLSCSAESWYKGAEKSRQIECQKLPGDDYRDCINQEQMDYDEYKKNREQLERDQKKS